MTENIKEPYRSGEGPGRLDIDGVEWWACDPYPTWYRWENGELFTDPAEWMPKDRKMAVRSATIEAEKATRLLDKAIERVVIAQTILDEVDH
jgi:hypothetical protein